MSHFRINGDIVTSDESAIIAALPPLYSWKKKEDLLIRGDGLSMSIYANGDQFLVSASILDKSEADAREVVLELGRHLAAEGIGYSLELGLEDGTAEEFTNVP